VINPQDLVGADRGVVPGGVEADLVAVGVVRERQDPADGGLVHAGVVVAERGQPLGQRLQGGPVRDADGEEVEVPEAR
jgi:hypothetical protein